MEEQLDFHSIFGILHNAYLIRDIVYNKEGEYIVVPKGTYIYVDIKNNIALIGEDHVDVASNEYMPIACA